MSLPRLLWLLGAPLLGAVLAGCATSPVAGVVRSTSAVVSSAPVATATPGTCRFEIIGIEDLRNEKGLGSMGPRVVDGTDFPGWLSDGLMRMPGYSKDATPVQLHVQVLKAYIQNMGAMKSANLVVRARIETPGRAAVSRNYRGVDDTMNWANGEGEVQEAFNRALADLTRHLQVDLKNACRS